MEAGLIMATIKVEIDLGLSLGSALKLRIAGKNYEKIALSIIEDMKEKLKENKISSEL